MTDIDTRFGWLLTETVEVVLEYAGEHETVCTVVEICQPDWEGRRAVLSLTDGRLHFDGEDIETEQFTSYLAVLDAPMETGNGRVILFANDTAQGVQS